MVRHGGSQAAKGSRLVGRKASSPPHSSSLSSSSASSSLHKLEVIEQAVSKLPTMSPCGFQTSGSSCPKCPTRQCHYWQCTEKTMAPVLKHPPHTRLYCWTAALPE